MRACKGWYPVQAHHSLSDCTDQAWMSQNKWHTSRVHHGYGLHHDVEPWIWRVQCVVWKVDTHANTKHHTCGVTVFYRPSMFLLMCVQGASRQGNGFGQLKSLRKGIKKNRNYPVIVNDFIHKRQFEPHLISICIGRKVEIKCSQYCHNGTPEGHICSIVTHRNKRGHVWADRLWSGWNSYLDIFTSQIQTEIYRNC